MVYVNTKSELIYKSPDGIPADALLTFPDYATAQAAGYALSKRDYPQRYQGSGSGPGQTTTGMAERLRWKMGTAIKELR